MDSKKKSIHFQNKNRAIIFNKNRIKFLGEIKK